MLGKRWKNKHDEKQNTQAELVHNETSEESNTVRTKNNVKFQQQLSVNSKCETKKLDWEYFSKQLSSSKISCLAEALSLTFEAISVSKHGSINKEKQIKLNWKRKIVFSFI